MEILNGMAPCGHCCRSGGGAGAAIPGPSKGGAAERGGAGRRARGPLPCGAAAQPHGARRVHHARCAAACRPRSPCLCAGHVTDSSLLRPARPLAAQGALLIPFPSYMHERALCSACRISCVSELANVQCLCNVHAYVCSSGSSTCLPPDLLSFIMFFQHWDNCVG